MSKWALEAAILPLGSNTLRLREKRDVKVSPSGVARHRRLLLNSESWFCEAYHEKVH